MSLVTSVKGDVLAATGTARAATGPVYVFDPTCSTGRVSSTWTPLVSCGTWAGARQMAGWLTSAADSAGGGDGSSKQFWRAMGCDLLAPLLFAAAGTDRGMAEVVRWAQRQEETEVADVLAQLGVGLACDMFDASRKLPPETRGSAYATVRAVLAVYGDPEAAASALSCEIDPAALLDDGGTLYLVAPLHAQERLRPLFEALVMSLVREAQNRAQAGQPVTPGLRLLLDEAGTVAPLRDLPAIAATGRGQGIQVVSVWQDRGQIEERYGRLADSVLTNHRGKLALSGIADLGTLDYFSKLLGDTDVDRHSVTDSTTGRSTSTSQQRERLAPADALRQLPLGHGLLVYGSLPPARVRFPLPTR